LKINYHYRYHYFIENKLKILQILEEIPTELNTLISYKNTTLEHSVLLNALRSILLQFLINSNYSKFAHTLNLGNIHEIYESMEIEIILINSILKTFLIWSSYSYTNFGNYDSNNRVDNDQENNYISGQISGNPGQISENSDKYQSDCLISMRYMTNRESVNDVYRFQTLIDVFNYSLKMLKTVNSNNLKKKSKFYEIFEIVILCLKIFNEFLLIPSPLEGIFICICVYV
jgi:hypothetical protein